MNKRKLLPCGWHELGAVEHWLGDMAHEEIGRAHV